MNAALEEVALVLISAAFELVTCRVFAGDFSHAETNVQLKLCEKNHLRRLYM